MPEIHVAYVNRHYRCYRVVAGREREFFGPRFGGPYLAGQYADLAAGRPISPLRRRVERSTPDSAGALGLGTASGDAVGTLDGLPERPLPPEVPRVAPSHRSRATG